MAVSVRMNPLLEKELALAAQRRGITKSQFVIEAVQRSLGHADPHRLLLQVEQEMASYRAGTKVASRPRSRVANDGGPSHSERLREALAAKHEAELRDWQALHGGTKAGAEKRPTPTRKARV